MTTTRSSRRKFLLAVGAGSAATAAAVATKLAPDTQAVTPDRRRGKGYQESAHVRNYYRTARV